MHVSKVLTPPAPAARNLGVDLQRPCWGQTCGGMLEVSRDAAAAGEEQLGRFAAEQSKYSRLYLRSGKLIVGATSLRRDRFVGRAFAAALTHVSRVVTPPAPAAKQLGEDLRQLAFKLPSDSQNDIL